ncbi:MAG: nicotinate-nucleotide adenylyltransferase [Candidatus Sumerlaeia bacterium]
MQLGLFGGSFNPPHLAHVMAALYCLETGAVEHILVVPCADHPFGKDLAPFDHRLQMCRLAFARLGEGVEVSDIEGRRPPPSFTIDTVRELRRTRPDASLRLIVGSDILEEFERWKDAALLRRLAPLLVVPRSPERPGAGVKGSAAQSAEGGAAFALPAVSSTTVRERLHRGEPVEGLIPRAVLDYIRRHRLYDADPGS